MARRPTPDPTIGKRIETRRKLRGWSIRLAADRAGIAHTTWSRIERGLLSADNRFTLADIAQALECETADLTGRPAVPADRASATVEAGAGAIRDALIDADLAEEAECTPRPMPELERDTDLSGDLWVRCDYIGLGRVLPRLLRELHAAAAGPDRQRALLLLVEATNRAQSGLRDLDHLGSAWLAAERCQQAAKTLGDPAAIAVAAFARATTATACGRYGRGLAIATRSVDELRPDLGGPGTLEAFGMLHLVGAFASRGLKRSDDAAAWLGEAADIANRTGETTAFRFYFGPTNIKIWRLAMDTDGGEPGRAVEIARQTRPRNIPAQFRQVAYYSDTARALAHTRNDREAVRMLLHAERLAPQWIRSAPLVRETVRSLLDRSRREAGGSALRGLCERVGVAL